MKNKSENSTFFFFFFFEKEVTILLEHDNFYFVLVCLVNLDCSSGEKVVKRN